MIEKTGERAKEYFNSGWFCAESAFRALAEAGGRYEPGMERMASGFCSGMARSSDLCGAVAGAIMGIGLYAGRTAPSPEQEMDITYAVVQDFLERFRSEYGSTNCLKLTGCDFATPEGQQKFKELNLGERCREICKFAVSSALSALRDAGVGPLATIDSEVAPCGLSCGKCLAYDGGDIQRHAQALQDALGGNFGSYAERFSGMNPVFGKYPQFREMLDLLASGTCTGCRGEGCLFGDCRVKECIKENGVTYCFECSQFPCDSHGLPGPLAERWRANNERMKEEGVERYALALRSMPRYP